MGAGYVSLDAKKRFDKYLKECGTDTKVSVGYGLTELGGVCILSPEYAGRSMIGYPLHGVKVKIFDEDKEKYFEEVGGSYRIKDEIKQRVEFKQHNLLKDPFPRDMHMIVCRNVLIYFTEEAKEQIFRQFCDALKSKGILFIGSTEQIINYKEIGFQRKNSFYYDKP